ncbi:MAG: tetratricopeptide repeat protein, partial [Opitutaceae bacterium]
FALHAGRLSLPVQAADTPAASTAPVELPPMMVEESISSAPWFHVTAGGAEFLSRCSASTTRHFVEAWLTKMKLVRVLVPEEFLARTDVPVVIVLYAQDLQQTVSAEIQRELQRAQAGEDGSGNGDSPRGNRVNIAPNMRLSDRDMHASIVYIDEALFDASTLSISPNHVRYLVRGRVPELPAWLVEGVERTWRRADFVIDPITLGPLVWNNQGESDALASDPTRPRALLPASELFATDALRAAESQHPRRVATRASEQELFFRWAIVSGGPMREALWKFAAHAARSPVTEEIFETNFGFDFSELRDRLSDYLPKAVEEMAWIDPGRLPPSPRIEVERATPNQIARVRGEWERLAIGHVQRRLPQVREPYIAQARRTLRRAFDAGDRDPRLLATMGLCEIDAGHEGGAREFLEPAIALGVVRPRAYHELARLRFAELQRGAPEAKLFSFTELAPIIEPLRRALTQAPPLAEVFVLLAEAWARCELSPNTAEFAELERGARLFAQRPTVGYPIALALARHGKNAEAAAVLDASAGHATDEKTRASVTRLRAELAAALTRPPEDKVPAAHP